jgi:hypothetical protein
MVPSQSRDILHVIGPQKDTDLLAFDIQPIANQISRPRLHHHLPSPHFKRRPQYFRETHFCYSHQPFSSPLHGTRSSYHEYQLQYQEYDCEDGADIFSCALLGHISGNYRKHVRWLARADQARGRGWKCKDRWACKCNRESIACANWRTTEKETEKK